MAKNPEELLLGTEYQGMPAASKYDFVYELLAEEQAKSSPDIELFQDMLDELSAQRALATLDDPEWDLTHNISIADKEGRTALFDPWQVQKEVWDFLMACFSGLMPVRLIIPKARRHGISAVVAAFFYIMVARGQGRRAMVVGHNDDDAETLFDEKYLFFHKNDPLGPVANKRNVGELKFDDPLVNGRITVRSAYGRRGVGLGGGYQFLHLTEPSRYPNPQAYALITGLIEAVPKPPAFSVIIAESTGYGQQGWFFDECIRAHKGESEFQLKFFPWFVRHDAFKSFCEHGSNYDCLCGSAVKNRENFEKSLDTRETLLREKYNLPLARLFWYRNTFLYDIKAPVGSLAEKWQLMKQEHPSEFMECFQSTGDSAFDQSKLNDLALATRMPKVVGDLTQMGRLTRDGAYIKGTPVPAVTRKDKGPLAIFERPMLGHRYAIGVDVAQGKIKGDFSVAMVFDRDMRVFVARYQARVGPKAIRDAARLLSKYYNDALICIEDNTAPEIIEDLAATDRSTLLYWRREADRTTAKTKLTKAYGYHMTTPSKKYAVHHTQDLLDREPGIFKMDSVLIEEMITFPQSMDGRGNVVYLGVPHGTGLHDDVVIAAMLALVCDKDMPLRGAGPGWKVKKDRPKPKSLQAKMDEMFDAQDEATVGDIPWS